MPKQIFQEYSKFPLLFLCILIFCVGTSRSIPTARGSNSGVQRPPVVLLVPVVHSNMRSGLIYTVYTSLKIKTSMHHLVDIGLGSKSMRIITQLPGINQAYNQIYQAITNTSSTCTLTITSAPMGFLYRLNGTVLEYNAMDNHQVSVFLRA